MFSDYTKQHGKNSLLNRNCFSNETDVFLLDITQLCKWVKGSPADDWMETLKEPGFSLKLHYKLKVFKPGDSNRIEYNHKGISCTLV
jgi:hypothetical protein